MANKDLILDSYSLTDECVGHLAPGADHSIFLNLDEGTRFR